MKLEFMLFSLLMFVLNFTFIEVQNFPTFLVDLKLVNISWNSEH